MIQKNNKNDPAGRVPLFDDTRRVPLKMIQKNDPTSYTQFSLTQKNNNL